MNDLPPETSYIMALNHIDELLSNMDRPSLEELAEAYLVQQICDGALDLPQSIFNHCHGNPTATADYVATKLLGHKPPDEASALADKFIKLYSPEPLTSNPE